MLGDANDSLARWIQGICGGFLLPFGVAVEYYDWTHLSGYSSITRSGAGGLGIGAIYLGYRCIRYAVTGQDNINRDDF